MYFTPLCTRACYNVTVKYPECVLWNRQEVTEVVRGATTPPTCQKPTMANQTTTADDEKASDDDRLDPQVREHVEQHGSTAHGYDHAPDRGDRA
jgi:hypothetical protein